MRRLSNTSLQVRDYIVRDWEITEKDFEKKLKSKYGPKNVHLHRFVDTKAIKGRVGGRGKAPPQPADYLVTTREGTHFAEVKHCSNKLRFSFSSIQLEQVKTAKHMISLGREYWFYIYCSTKKKWYKVPAFYILKSQSKKSASWEELELFLW